MSQSREEARPHYHTRAHQHTQYKPLITWSDILHYRLSLHPPLIRTAVTEDPFHKSVSATVQTGPAQWITTSGTGGTHQKISPVWVDSPHMSKPLYLSKKRTRPKRKEQDEEKRLDDYEFLQHHHQVFWPNTCKMSYITRIQHMLN